MMPKPDDQPPTETDLRCPQCGYNLHLLSSERCPECGLPLDRVRALGSQIPWVHRRSIGLWRAYWRTARLATFRPGKFFRNLPTSVEHADAQRFRWVTVTLFAGALFLLGMVVPLIDVRTRQTMANDPWLVGTFAVAFVLTAAALTGLPSYFFHPRHLAIEEQNRAVAMSYYACAPLAWIAVAFVFFGAANALLALGGAGRPWTALPVLLLLLLGMAVWWKGLIQLGLHVFRRRGALLRLIFVLPVLWALVGAGTLFGIPLLVTYVLTLIYALR